METFRINHLEKVAISATFAENAITYKLMDLMGQNWYNTSHAKSLLNGAMLKGLNFSNLKGFVSSVCFLEQIRNQGSTKKVTVKETSSANTQIMQNIQSKSTFLSAMITKIVMRIKKP